ncbi:hypothetical protein EB796_023340 [Bugula neritina]|uniref:Uncharacterized protein n=1 Tax=Bugula neritina TaxID=10212 RepID=A0A7J7IWX2_BUGNE|nr:hypothetical protein EB796_023340 [Bugula neritina]
MIPIIVIMLFSTFLDETQVESDADSDLSDHEDFYLPEEDQHVKMEVSVTRKAAIKRLFYSNQVTRYSSTDNVT